MDRRVLVLGSSGHGRDVTAYAWDDLPDGLNVADFDIVILNFGPFSDPELALWADVDSFPSGADFVRLMFSPDAEIIAIGDPLVDLGEEGELPVNYWLPVWPKKIERSSGQTFQVVEETFAFYFSIVEGWSFFTSNDAGRNDSFLYDSVELKEFDRNADGLGGQVFPITQTRFGQPVAFGIQMFTMQGSNRPGRGGQPSRYSRPAFWLPSPTALEANEAIDLILTKRYHVNPPAAAPSWAASYELPSEAPLREEIVALKKEAEALEQTILERTRVLVEAGRPRQMLYETGEVLERVVREVLEGLGATVPDAPGPGREDGRLIDPAGRRGTLEIKGRTGPLKLSDVRQLDQWVRDNIVEGWESKGVLIANLLSDLDPAERRDVFPDNCVKTATRFELSLMTTSQLYRAVVLQQEGSLEINEFWKRVMSACGPVLLPG